ncbi:hypothetical protein Droror1_Dr00024379 [Drosera rotundifolia]
MNNKGQTWTNTNTYRSNKDKQVEENKRDGSGPCEQQQGRPRFQVVSSSHTNEFHPEQHHRALLRQRRGIESSTGSQKILRVVIAMIIDEGLGWRGARDEPRQIWLVNCSLDERREKARVSTRYARCSEVSNESGSRGLYSDG